MPTLSRPGQVTSLLQALYVDYANEINSITAFETLATRQIHTDGAEAIFLHN